MDETLFEDLVNSLQEAKALSRGKTPASRRFTRRGLEISARVKPTQA